MSRLTPSTNKGTVGQNALKIMINDERTQKKFRELLGKKAPGFLTSLLNTINGNKQLQQADASSIMKAGAIAATLDLPIEPNFGYAYIVPYNNKEKNEAQFQMGYKGFVQLAMRTGQYKKITVSELYDGQFKSYDPITDTLEYDLNDKISDEITHYIAYFKLLNGFEKYFIMSKEEVEEHARKYSKTFNKSFSNWKTNFDGMAKKTVLKLLLSKFGIMSIEMQTAQKADQAVIKDIKDNNNIEVEYVDNDNNFSDTTEESTSVYPTTDETIIDNAEPITDEYEDNLDGLFPSNETQDYFDSSDLF